MEQVTSSAIHQANELANQHPRSLITVYRLINGTCCYASPSHSAILHYEPAQMIGKPWQQFASTRDHAHITLAATDALLHGRSIDFGFRAVTQSGDSIPMRGVAWIVKDDHSGEPYLTFQATPTA